MLSTPAPMPTSIMPHLMALAISITAWSPLEHCLLRDLTAAVSGNPATRAAARNSVAPPPGGKTEPTAISSTKAGSILDFSIKDLNTPASRSDAAVSLKPPLPPLVKAVRRAQVTTMSSGCLAVIAETPPLPVRCEVTCERRCVAASNCHMLALRKAEYNDVDGIFGYASTWRHDESECECSGGEV